MNSQPSTINSPPTTLGSVRSTIPVEIRDDSCNSCLDFISSDESLDRYNEIISASGWKLDNYQRNPVFQNAHQYGDIIFTLGKALTTEVRLVGGGSPLPLGVGEGFGVRAGAPSGSHLFQRIQFATDVNPMARIAYGLYRGKFLNAVSVGFLPVRWENGTDKTPYRRKFLEQELLEVSAVGIPANPNALALGLKSGAIAKSDLKDVLDLFRSTLAVPESDEGGPRLNDQVIESLRTFQKILKS